MADTTAVSIGQRDLLRRLADNSFYVPVKFTEQNAEEEGESVSSVNVRCRELPLTTLLAVVSELIVRVGDRVMSSSGTLIQQNLEELASIPAADKAKREEVLATLLGSLVPTILHTLPHTPDLVERILVDCIYDADLDTVHQLGTVQALALLTAIVERIDNEEARKYVAGFFAALWSKFKKA